MQTTRRYSSLAVLRAEFSPSKDSTGTWMRQECALPSPCHRIRTHDDVVRVVNQGGGCDAAQQKLYSLALESNESSYILQNMVIEAAAGSKIGSPKLSFVSK